MTSVFRKMPAALIFTLAVLLQMSCYVRKEGCLDTLASNFDVTADDGCSDCCTYPALQLNIKHMAGDSLLDIRKIYTNNLGQNYQLLDIRYYLSGFTLIRPDQSTTRIIEVIYNEDQSVIQHNDMHICRITDNTLTAGTVKAFGQFDRLLLNMGLSDTLLNTSFTELPSNHVLLKANKLKDAAGNTTFATLRYVRIKQERRDTVNLNFGDSTDRFYMNIDSTVITRKGENIIYNLKNDYKQLFMNVNLDTLPAVIKKAMTPNLKKAIGVN